MNVFEAVKQSVTTRQAAEHYGIHVGRNGMACCPFHHDKTPSMKLDRRYHCFGCGADGDVIDFAAALYGLGKKEAAVQLAQDFGLSYEDWKPPGKAKKPKPRQKSPEEQFQEAKNCALPGFVDSKNEEKTERNAGYLVVSHSGGGMLRQGTRKGIRRTPANRGMRAHWVVKGLDISEDVCHGMCP